MLNGVNQSSFRSFRGFKENICARFFLQPIWELRAHPRPCKDAANTSSVLRRRLLSLTVCKHIIQSQTCPLLPAFLSLFRSLPFKIWLKLFFLWACDLLQRRPVALFFEGTSGQNTLDKTLHVENFGGVGDETWMTKKAPSVKKGFRDKNICKKGFGGRNICQASSMRWEIAANARDWKESGDPEKEKIYWVKYFHSWGFGEQQNWDKKKVKLCFLQQIFGPGKSFSEIKVKLLLQKIFSQILGSGKSRSKIKEKLL